MDAQKRARFLEICRERSFERKRVVLASGRESDFFIDCKQTILTAEGHALSGELLFELLAELPECDAVGGVELGGCPLASAVSLVSFQRGRPLPALYVRKERKDHGSAKLVEGDKSSSWDPGRAARRCDHDRWLELARGRGAEDGRSERGGDRRVGRPARRRCRNHPSSRDPAREPRQSARFHGGVVKPAGRWGVPVAKRCLARLSGAGAGVPVYVSTGAQEKRRPNPEIGGRGFDPNRR